MSNTVNNNIPFVPENTIDPAAGLNESLNIIDMMLQLAVLSVNANTPPASPAEGDRHIIGTAPTGAWAGWAGFLARYLDGYWRFLPARLAFNLADGVLYGRRTTTWVSVAGSGGAAWGAITGTLSAQTDLANALAGKVATTQLGANSGVATLDAAGKIPVSQLPPLAVNEVFTVASQAAMLALTAERGDVAIRTDQAGRAYILSADAPGTLANWISLDQALSVALSALNALTPATDRLPYFDGTSTAALAVFTGQARTLLAAATQAAQKAVLGLDQVNNTSDASKPVSAAQQAVFDLKAPLVDPAFMGKIGLGGAAAPNTGFAMSLPQGVLTGVTQYGIRLSPVVDPSVANTFIGQQVDPTIPNLSGTIAELTSFRVTAPVISGSTPQVTLLNGFYATAASSAQIGEYRAFRGAVNAVSGVNRWNAYMEGTAPNHMSGDLRIGTTTAVGSEKVTVAGSVVISGGSLAVNDGNFSVVRATGSPVMIMDAPAGNQKYSSLRSGNLERWRFGCSGAAESGSNVGTDFVISRYDDAGAGISTPFSITRSTGQTNLASLSVTGALAAGGPVLFGRYTLSGLPSASANQNALIIVTNATGGAKVCWSNGTNWCLLNTSTVVS
ncbi:hypothetical protein ASF84_05535 [Pseudomonas sp. Leaf127]|uniref:DUF2793 domain-containing protein n=1 Tax=Pseudomonas sp. Leaf127 TaxID=1736267 RepID=UPI0007027165|nr:DUF2793 domain-containing protein [Pseudomonas sp. Leaf127]KQQ60169.1 hypothetical protein ASF84_05535 [Pseudomonas sp. Leaf127]